MRLSPRSTWLALGVACLAPPACRPHPARHGNAPSSAAPEAARVALSHPLPTLDGAHLAATLVEVSYPPGGASGPHSHPCPVIGYVIAGAFRTRVNDGPETVVHAGRQFRQLHQVHGRGQFVHAGLHHSHSGLGGHRRGADLGILLVAGVWLRVTALASAALLALFGTAMAISFGLRSPLDYSVFSASAGALLLALWEPRSPLQSQEKS